MRTPNLLIVRNADFVLLINEKEVDEGIWNIYNFIASSEPRMDMYNCKHITMPQLATSH